MTVGGGFVLRSLVANGGMSDVWLAVRADGQRAAMKFLLRTPLDAHQPLRERFVTERDALAACQHPGLVQLLESESTPPWLALAYIPGLSLAQELTDAVLPSPRAATVCADLAEAVQALHDAGWLHGDIKPANVLLDNRFQPARTILIDFGLATRVDDQPDPERYGVSVGSPHSTPPERVRGRHVDARSDVYALGCLAFRALAGRWPFRGPSSAATLALQVGAPVPDLPDNVDPRLAGFVRSLLAKDPDERPASARLVAEALRGLGLVEPTVSPEPGLVGWLRRTFSG